MNYKINHANIKDWAKNYDGELFDGILCDPPYELGFMGKSWDSSGIAFDVEMWKSIYDLLKPGAHLLAFSGSRTYHRMAVAIEDAGFEIRDMIEYVYGSGFPKSLNVEKQLERMLHEKRAKQDTERGVRLMPDTDVSQTESTNQEQGEVLQPSVSEQSISQSGQPTDNVRTEQPSVERRSNTQATKGELQRCPLCEMPNGIFANGSQGWIHNGTQASSGSTPEQNADTNGSSTPHRPQSKQQRTLELEAICDKCRTQAIRGARGIGSALKPAHEPICLARKPLDGTIGQNFLKHGTGGLNIDGTRVGTENIQVNRHSGYNSNSLVESTKGKWKGEQEQVSGRFPANLIHDGSDEVEAVFPQTGKSSGGRIGNKGSMINTMGNAYEKGDPGFGDSGSASRYFKVCNDLVSDTPASCSEKTYDVVGINGTKDQPGLYYTAKASKSERNAGLEGFEERQTTGGGGLTAELREDGSLETASAGGKYGSVKAKQTNFHPTVKPLSLTKYLATLIKPPTGGRLLVPFSGSGSEMIGALQAGWEYVEGVELTEEYIPIAKARIKYWTNKETKQMELV